MWMQRRYCRLWRRRSRSCTGWNHCLYRKTQNSFTLIRRITAVYGSDDHAIVVSEPYARRAAYQLKRTSIGYLRSDDETVFTDDIKRRIAFAIEQQFGAFATVLAEFCCNHACLWQIVSVWILGRNCVEIARMAIWISANISVCEQKDDGKGKPKL
jgi:hypothetical protein